MASGDSSTDDQSRLNSGDVEVPLHRDAGALGTNEYNPDGRNQTRMSVEEMDLNYRLCVDEGHDPRATEGFLYLNRNRHTEIQEWAQAINTSNPDESPLMSLTSEDISEHQDSVLTVDDGHDPRAIRGLQQLNRKRNIEIQEWAQTAINATHPCKECEVIKSTCWSIETLEFWNSVECTKDLSSMCHLKFYKDFTRRLQEVFPHESALRNTRTMNVFRRLLLQTDTTDIAARVSLSCVVRLVTFFGPIQEHNGHCFLLGQIHQLIEKSLQYKDRSKKEKVSWFAGEMNRDDAEECLKGQTDYTYLVRMSQTNGELGDFALSIVKEGVVHHLAIQRKQTETMINPCFLFNEKEFSSVPAMVEHVKFNAFECEDGITLWCKSICPGLPFNALMSGYKKAGKRS